MPKGAQEDHRAATRAVLLRERIRELEISAAGFGGFASDKPTELLTMRDEVEDELAGLEEMGLDLRPERTRVKTVDNILVRKARQIEGALAPSGGFRAARRSVMPTEERWWWFLDDYLAEKRRQRAKKFVIIALVAGVLLVGGNYVMNRFFGLDPVQREARGYVSAGEQAVMTGDYEAAISEYKRAIEVSQDLYEAYIGLGLAYEALDRDAESREAFARAEALIGDRATYLLALARGYTTRGDSERALAFADEAVALNPKLPEALLIRGGAHEGLGNRQEAIRDYERAGELAQESGQDALYVLARMRMGMLLQSGSSGMPATGGGPGF